MHSYQSAQRVATWSFWIKTWNASHDESCAQQWVAAIILMAACFNLTWAASEHVQQSEIDMADIFNVYIPCLHHIWINQQNRLKHCSQTQDTCASEQIYSGNI